MCDCIKRLEQALKQQDDNITNVSIVNYEILSQRTFSTFAVKSTTKKKPKDLLVLHTYCPTCGKKYAKKGEGVS